MKERNIDEILDRFEALEGMIKSFDEYRKTIESLMRTFGTDLFELKKSLVKMEAQTKGIEETRAKVADMDTSLNTSMRAIDANITEIKGNGEELTEKINNLNIGMAKIQSTEEEMKGKIGNQEAIFRHIRGFMEALSKI